MTMVINSSSDHTLSADVAHGLAVCELGGALTGGLLLLLLGPVATAAVAAALHLAAWLAGAALLRRFRWVHRQSGHADCVANPLHTASP